MSHPRVYNALRHFGHSGSKASEILIDAKRGDRWALHWIKSIARMHRARLRVVKELANDPVILEALS